MLLPIMKNGVMPSCIALDNNPTTLTLLDFFCETFPHIGASIWRQRFEQGEVLNQAGLAVAAEDLLSMFAGQKLYYYRHVHNETPIPFQAEIIYEDEHLLVADKPHFLPVMPAGDYLQETLLVRLRRAFNLPELSPLHRIDRETAGVVMFAKHAKARGVYQALFRNRHMHKSYEAIASWQQNRVYPFEYASRLAESGEFFLMTEVEGEVNSRTQIDVIEHNDVWARYALSPISGKRHQLRVHMAALGMPLLNDCFYPQVRAVAKNDFSRPLQLLAKSINFIDPFDFKEKYFCSSCSLHLPNPVKID